MQSNARPHRVLTSIRMPRATLQTLQALAALTGRTQSDIILSALEPYMKRELQKRRMGELVARVAAERQKARKA